MEPRWTRVSGSHEESSKTAGYARASHSSSPSCRPQITERIKSAPLFSQKTQEETFRRKRRPSKRRETESSASDSARSSHTTSPLHVRHAVSSKDFASQNYVRYPSNPLFADIPSPQSSSSIDGGHSLRKPTRLKMWRLQ